MTAQEVARQVRNAFYGAEVLRQQRGRNEIKVMVRLPESERLSQSHIEDLMIWTKTGKQVPLKEVVHVERGRLIPKSTAIMAVVLSRLRRMSFLKVKPVKY